MPAYPLPFGDGRLRPAPFQLCPGCPEAIGSQLVQIATAAPASTVWPSANLAIFYPFVLSEPRKALRMWAYNGAAVAGNIDAGIYDASGNKLVSIGSTAQSGTSALQLFDITDTWLAPFTQYYAGLALSDASTATIFRFTGSVNVGQIAGAGVVQMATAFALPSSATFAALTNNYLPWFGIDFVGTI